MLNNGLLRSMACHLRSCWQSMVVTDLFYKLLAFMVLSPMFSVILASLLAIGGNGVLSDVDIALFFVKPFGWICAIALGSVWLAILALEQASLLVIVAACSVGKKLSAVESLLFAGKHSISILRVAARLIGQFLMALAPFLLVAFAVYLWLLNEYDINYYLDEMPREFALSAIVGLLLTCCLLALMLRLYSSWFLALPLVLFDRVLPKFAIQKSRQVVAGHRSRVLLWLVVWFLLGLVVNTAATIIVGAVGYLVVPSTVGSLTVLAGRFGLMLIVLGVVGVAINVGSTIGYSLMLFYGYQQLNPSAAQAIDRINFSEASQISRWRMVTRWRIVSFTLIGCLFTILVGVTTINSLQLEDRVEVMAHRGSSSVAPENSLAAVRQAIEDGADWVEVDVQETSDGEVIVIHDSDLMKLARNKLKVWDATAAELQAIDIGSSTGAEFASERIPTLAELLDVCRGKIGVIIELKYYGHDQQLEQRVVDIVERCDMAQHVMVMSLKPAGVKKIKAIRPTWKCGVLMSIAVGDIKKIDADFLAVNAKFTTQNLVNRAHHFGKEVFVWTVDDAATMSMLMNRGVDGILTNRPDLARRVLRHRSEMNSSERLLTEIATLLGVDALESSDK